MIIFIGDTHGWFSAIKKVAEAAPEDAMIVQVGDFGFWPEFRENWIKTDIQRPIHFIDGNHEFLPQLLALREETEVWPNLFYLPRGTIKQIGEYRVGFCGGAASIDQKMRTPNKDWFACEEVCQEDIDRFRDEELDLLVTHCPPHNALTAVVDPRMPADFGMGYGWNDPSGFAIEKIRAMTGHPFVVSGHVHRSAYVDGVKILNINESWECHV